MDGITVILTVWKRNHLEEQLNSLLNQSEKPDVIWVQQTMKHVDVSDIIDKYQSYVKYTYYPENKGVFGRFESVLKVNTDFTFVLDDDMIPGKNYIKIAKETCIRLNGIISSSGRIIFSNQMSYIGDNTKFRRSYSHRDIQVDFGTNSWFFKTKWIKQFFKIPAYSIFNGEDMHLSASCKIFQDINTYVPTQLLPEDSGNTNRKYSVDTDALHLQSGFQKERFEIIKYLTNKGWLLLEKDNDSNKRQINFPDLSVILPIYNVHPIFLKESVESILSQTYTNFELLIIDNGSNECSVVLSELSDERIRLIRSSNDSIYSFDKVVEHTKGKYIVWMNADDIMMPNRLLIQYNFMNIHPEIDLCGSWAEQIGDCPEIIKQPTGHDLIILSFIFGRGMNYSSIIMRNDSLAKIQDLKNSSCTEYYKLCVELANIGFRFANISEILIKCRTSEKEENQEEKISESMKQIQLEYIEKITEQMAKKNELYNNGFNSIVDLVNEGLISWESLKQIVYSIYLDYLKKDL